MNDHAAYRGFLNTVNTRNHPRPHAAIVSET